jgi:predicted RNA methylase
VRYSSASYTTPTFTAAVSLCLPATCASFLSRNATVLDVGAGEGLVAARVLPGGAARSQVHGEVSGRAMKVLEGSCRRRSLCCA